MSFRVCLIKTTLNNYTLSELFITLACNKYNHYNYIVAIPIAISDFKYEEKHYALAGDTSARRLCTGVN